MSESSDGGVGSPGLSEKGPLNFSWKISREEPTGRPQCRWDATIKLDFKG